MQPGSQSLRIPERRPTPPEIAPRLAEPGEQADLLGWLDRGLRAGRPGRLEQEYPLLFGPGAAPAVQAVAWGDNAWLSHALGCIVQVEAGGRRLPLGMIGLVYTDPAARGRGLASACIERCCRELASRGASLAVLWSDRHPFYARLGFHRAGREMLYALSPEVLAAARGLLSGELPETGPPEPEDWSALEALYALQPSRALRPPGSLRLLAAAPDCRLRVARRERRPVAYVAAGRGDDFTGVAHEWAGDPAGVVACLEDLVQRVPDLSWLTGPVDTAPAPLLRQAGAEAHPGCFALARLLDAETLWESLAQSVPDLTGVGLRSVGEAYALHGPRGEVALDAAEALALFLGPDLPPAAGSALDGPSRRALCQALPWPLFVWGFDSI